MRHLPRIDKSSRLSVINRVLRWSEVWRRMKLWLSAIYVRGNCNFCFFCKSSVFLPLYRSWNSPVDKEKLGISMSEAVRLAFCVFVRSFHLNTSQSQARERVRNVLLVGYGHTAGSSNATFNWQSRMLLTWLKSGIVATSWGLRPPIVLQLEHSHVYFNIGTLLYRQHYGAQSVPVQSCLVNVETRSPDYKQLIGDRGKATWHVNIER